MFHDEIDTADAVCITEKVIQNIISIFNTFIFPHNYIKWSYLTSTLVRALYINFKQFRSIPFVLNTISKVLKTPFPPPYLNNGNKIEKMAQS